MKTAQRYLHSRSFQHVHNVFCPTGKGGGVDPTCKVGSPSFKTVSDAEAYITKTGLASLANLNGLTPEEASGVVSGLIKSMTVGGVQLKLKSISVAEGYANEPTAFGWGEGHIRIDPKGIEMARSHDPDKVIEMFKDEPIGKRNFLTQDAVNVREYFELAIAHEVGHHAETALLLDVQKGVRNFGSISENEILTLSAYATQHPVEMFAELHAAHVTGRLHKFEPKLQGLYDSIIKTADPDPIKVYIRNVKSNQTTNVHQCIRSTTANVFCPTGKGGGINPTCKVHGHVSIPMSTDAKGFNTYAGIHETEWQAWAYEDKNIKMALSGKSIIGDLDSNGSPITESYARELHETGKKLVKASETYSTPQEKLYRGVSFESKAEALNHFSVGKTIETSLLTATTPSKETAEEYATTEESQFPVVMKMVSETGHRGVYTAPLALPYKDLTKMTEGEFVMPAGVKYRVESSKVVKGVLQVELNRTFEGALKQVVDPTPASISAPSKSSPKSANLPEGAKWIKGSVGTYYYLKGKFYKVKSQTTNVQQCTCNISKSSTKPTARNPLRGDPTRTATLRRKFIADLETRFSMIGKDVRKLILEEDAFDLVRSTTANVFCPTGKGGGVDPTCKPGGIKRGGGGSVLPQTTEVPFRSFEPDFIDRVSKTIAESLNFPVEKISVEEGTKSFIVGGQEYLEAGHYHPDLDEVHVRSGFNWQTTDQIVTVVSHEVQHHKYNKVREALSIEEHKIWDSSNPSDIIRMSGQLKEGQDKNFPVYAKLHEKFESLDFKQELADGDGITEYSKSYWKDWSDHKHEPRSADKFDLAVNETLAEMAALKSQASPIKAAKPWEALYKTVEQSYTSINKKSYPNKLPKLGEPIKTKPVLNAEIPLVKDMGNGLVEIRFADGTIKFAQAVTNQTTKQVANAGRFEFNTTPQKIEVFRKWLKRKMEQLLIGEEAKLEDDWWNKYIMEGYAKGAGRAFEDTRKPYARGYASEGRISDFYRGTKEEFLRSSFAQPVAKEKVKLLAGRTYTDLKGISESMSTKLVRVLTDGLVQGKNPRVIAKDIADVVNGIDRKRALTIARTEIIRCHAEGQLDAFDSLGVTEVGVAAEWSTAEDERVCELCQPLDGIVIKVSEAHGLLPRHPNCRCAFIPANVGEQDKTQKRTKAQVEKAIDKSIEAEIPTSKEDERTLAQQRELSKWQGADADIDKQRPKSVLNK